MASRYRKIDVAMYGDQKFRELSKPQPNGQTLWVYLLTGPHNCAIPGLSCIGEAAMSEALGWSLEAFRKAFAEVKAKGMADADWQARVVWIPNAVKYNPPQSVKVIKAWANLWPEIPECELKVTAFATLKAFAKGYHEAFGEAFSKAFPKAFPELRPVAGAGAVAGDKKGTNVPSSPLANSGEGTDQPREGKTGGEGAAAPPTPAQADPKAGMSRLRGKRAGATDPRPEHGEVRAFFLERWKARYGTAYPTVQAKDNAHVKWILDKCERNPERAKAIIRRYLADDEPFLCREHHPLGLLVSKFARYVGEASPPEGVIDTDRIDGTDEDEAWESLGVPAAQRPASSSNGVHP